MPRAIWSGSITFGLVNVPVRMYSAINEQDVRFHLLHTKDDGRIGFEKVCKKDGKPVPENEIARAYEISKGKYVQVTDKDLEAAGGAAYKAFEIADFVPYEEIDPIYFEKTFLLGPDRGAENVYALLVRAMESSGLVALGKFVMRGKQHLGCLRIRQSVLVLEKMYFADEVRPIPDLAVKDVRVDKAQLEMASELITRFTGSFDIEKYRDDYRQAVLGLIRAKWKGKDVRPDVPERAEPPDLMDALRASIEARRTSVSRRRRRSNGHSRKSTRRRSRAQGR